MALICDFGTAPVLKADGFKGIGTIRGSDSEVLEQFYSDDVCLVMGGEIGPEKYEFFVMVK